jgi:hypothetical protein
MSRFAPTAVLFASLLGLTGCHGGNSASSSNNSPTTPSTPQSPPSQTLPVPTTGVTPQASSANVPGAGELSAAGVSVQAVGATPATPPGGDPAEGDSRQGGRGPAGTDTRAESGQPTAASPSPEEVGYVQASPPGAPGDLPQARTFRPEGVEQALRITYDDLDLLKWLRMDPVTPDCTEKMPAWMRDLNGKKVRLRGFMKPHEISTGFRRFIFVKDTGLCCFGPAGKIYDLIQVTLQKGTTTDYIELTPFDVIGTFRIEIAALDDTQEVYELFHIDDAKIVRK